MFGISGEPKGLSSGGDHQMVDTQKALLLP